MDAAQHKYVEVDHKHLCAKHGDECRYLLRALAIDVPVVTIRGSISPDVSRVYPPIPWSASNLFELPDPFGDEARYEGTPFDGAYHYLKIHYADGGADAALVALPLELKGAWLGETGCEWDPTASWPDPACKFERVAWFSVNVDAYRQPRKVELYRANGRYPNINADDPRNELLHERLIDPVDVPSLPPMHRVGGAQIDSEAGVNVDRVCDGPALRTEDFSCADPPRVSWRPGATQLYFEKAEEPRHAAPAACSGAPHETFTVPVTNEAGATYELTLRAQRWVSRPASKAAVRPSPTRLVDRSAERRAVAAGVGAARRERRPAGGRGRRRRWSVMSASAAPSIRRASSTPSM